MDCLYPRDLPQSEREKKNLDKKMRPQSFPGVSCRFGDVYNKWYDDQRYMEAYKTTRTLRGVDIESAMMGFNMENLTAKQALLEAKDKHTRRWQTKEGTYRLKEKLLPDVRDTAVEMADTSTGP